MAHSTTPRSAASPAEPAAEQGAPILDAHMHLWDPATRDHAWLRSEPRIDRAFSLDDYVATARPLGVERAVLVQVLGDLDESAQFLRLAASSDILAGVVAWVPFECDDVARILAELRAGPGGERLVGVRHLVQSEPDPAYLSRPTVIATLAELARDGIAVDLLVRPPQLPAALDALWQLPELRAVIDHGAKPDIAAAVREPWWSDIAVLADCPHTTCKLSGLATEAGARWSAERIRPYSDRLLECFGPQRLLFGSDWPVATAVASYDEVLALARELLRELDDAGRRTVLHDNAARVYALGELPVPSGPEEGAPC